MAGIIGQLSKISDKASAFWWNGLSQACARFVPGTRSILSRNDPLSHIPFLSALLPFAALLFGFIAGIDSHAAMPVYTGVPWYLAGLFALSILSPFLGLLAFAGFIGGEIMFFLDLPLRRAGTFYPLAIVSGWIFLAQLVLIFPLIATAISRPPDRFFWLHPLVAAPVIFFLSELWTRLAMIVLRPLFLWQGQDPDMRLINFGETEWEVFGVLGHMLSWIGAGAMLAYFALSIILHMLSTRGQRETALQPVALPAFIIPWRAGYWHGLFWRCAVFTLLVAGLFTKFWSAFLFAGLLYGAHTARALLAHFSVVGKWDEWMHRVPPLIRLAAGYIIAVFTCYGLAILLRGSLEWRTLEALAAMIVLSIIITLPLWPQSKKGEAPPPPPVFLGKLLSLIAKHQKSISATLWGGIVLSAGAAFAHHCSFKPGCECLTDDWILAQTAAAAVFLFSLTPQGGWLEALLGRDLLTGQALQNWERLIRLIPGGKGLRLAAAGIGKLPAKTSILMNKAHKGGGEKIIGAHGARTPSKTLWRGEGKERIDVENPNPSKRHGQVHYQDNKGNKYIFDLKEKKFKGAPDSVNDKLKDKKFHDAVVKGIEQYLGEKL